MDTINRLSDILVAIARFVVPPPRRFTCANCERNARCGLPPSDECIYALMTMEGDRESRSRPPNFLYPAVWPR